MFSVLFKSKKPKKRSVAIHDNDLSTDVAIRFESVSKRYRIYNNIRDSQLALVSKRFRRTLPTVYALRKIEFTIKRGECVNIYGKSHSGKSTLLHLMTGLIMPSTGSVETHGKIVVANSVISDFDKEQTLRPNLMNRARMVGLNKPAAKELVDKIIEFTEVSEWADKPFKYAPKQLQRRLGLAISINLPCDILLLEALPTPSDKEFYKSFMKLLKDRLSDSKKTTVFITTNSLKTLPIDRFIELEAGEAVLQKNKE
jgi:lipopolysaccharide transport system ATP-binding protein